MSDRIHTRIDPELKQDVADILRRLGMSEADAIRMFYHQVKLHDGLPFPVRMKAPRPASDPDKVMQTLEAIRARHRNNPPGTLKEMLAWRKEGQR